MHILFYDTATPLAYTDDTLRQQALGGTEATIIRVAHALALSHTVYIAQHCRDASHHCESHGVHYISLEAAHALHPDVVILLRQSEYLEKVALSFPHSQLFFWMHNLPPKNFYLQQSLLEKFRYTIIAVSHFHRERIQHRLKNWYQRLLSHQQSIVPVRVIYNPIDDNLHSDHTPWNKNQLIFLSSPQKGLDYTLKMFTKILKIFPEYHLYIANPGHRKMDLSLPKQATFLGELPHAKIIQKLRESFCVFYPQYEKEETFGLVYAEANAVGTPVLAHDLGAAREVLSDETQLIDGRSFNSVVEKISEWREQRLLVSGKLQFKLDNVIAEWNNLFNAKSS